MLSDRGFAGLAYRTGLGRLSKPGAKKGVIFAPGATQNLDWWFDLNHSTHELDRVTEQGFPVASLSTLSTWGNSVIRADMSALRTNLQTAGFFAAGKVHLVGVSMGGLTVLNWAKANPTLVQSITLLIPCVNPQGIYDQNRGSFAAAIGAAHGGRPPDSENPMSSPSAWAGLPIDLYYSTTDAITLVAEQATFAAGSGATLRSMGAQGHFWNVPWGGSELARFITAHD